LLSPEVTKEAEEAIKPFNAGQSSQVSESENSDYKSHK
jgi:hypothetical protein